MKILVTGGAGFIGSHLSERLLTLGHDLTIVDNFNDFYPPAVKRSTISEVKATARRHGSIIRVCEGDIRDRGFLETLCREAVPEAVIHLAAMAGVRRFLFASSSSVYGNNPTVPFAESDPVDNPISPYAATKKGGELLCHTWHHLYGISVACLRFFTVYGPRQRPDLAIHKFARIISSGGILPLYGDGSTSRDYTYIDDIVDGVVRALHWTGGEHPVYGIFNLGGSRPVELRRLVELLERELGVPAQRTQHPMQPGDVERTYADLTRSAALLGYRPTTEIETGIARFVAWFRRQQEATGHPEEAT